MVVFQGPCCTNDCEFRRNDKCRDDNGCRGESFCDGSGNDSYKLTCLVIKLNYCTDDAG